MNKIVLITGASSGIGKSIATTFAKNGFNVVITYNTKATEANELKNSLISSYNVDCDTVKCNLNDENEIKKMVDFVINKYHKVDVLINNAGIAKDCDIQDKKKEYFQEVLNVNLIGTFLITRMFGNFMNEQKEGSIVNISSNNALDCYYPESIDYDASKAGIISLTHNFAKYYAPNIRVNCICPGWVNTNMNDAMSEEFKNKEINKIMLKRFAEKEEIAEVVYFVANATYINNAVIRVDGGISTNE